MARRQRPSPAPVGLTSQLKTSRRTTPPNAPRSSKSCGSRLRLSLAVLALVPPSQSALACDLSRNSALLPRGCPISSIPPCSRRINRTHTSRTHTRERFSQVNRALRLVALLALTATIAACGGGGGGSAAPSGSSGSNNPSAPNSPNAASNNWDSFVWDQGNWS